MKVVSAVSLKVTLSSGCLSTVVMPVNCVLAGFFFSNNSMG